MNSVLLERTTTLEEVIRTPKSPVVKKCLERLHAVKPKLFGKAEWLKQKNLASSFYTYAATLPHRIAVNLLMFKGKRKSQLPGLQKTKDNAILMRTQQFDDEEWQK